MSIDSSAIDTAVIDYLRSDTTLAGLLTDGWYQDEAPPRLTRFGIVSLIAGTDEAIFGQRAAEDCLYLVKAVVLNDDSGRARAAAARIDELLDPQPPAPPATFPIAGYALILSRRDERIRSLEVDGTDNQIRWQHRGGRYQVIAAPRSS
jgi:hypothetical protein